jgi:hypothetical protein
MRGLIPTRPTRKVVLAAVAAFIGLSTCPVHLQAQKVYRDPGGAYSVNIPNGWQTEPQPGSPMISLVDAKTKVSVTLGVMRGPAANTPTAESELQGIEKQFPQSCPQAKIEQRGATKLAGLNGSFLVVHCNGADGPQLMKFTAASKPGEVALMVTASPGNAYLKDLLPLESIKGSFKALPVAGAQGATGMPAMSGRPGSMQRTGGGAPMQGMGSGQQSAPGMGGSQAATPGMEQGTGTQGTGASQPPMQPMANGPAQSQPQVGGQFPSPGDAGSGAYHDPQGRYSLAVPSGWNTASDNGNLTLSSGASWVTVATGSGAKPADANHQILQQIQAQFKEFKVLNEGDFQNNGHAAHGTNATGINPKGERVSLLLVSVSAGNGNYLMLISSTPNDQAKQFNGTVMQLAQSIRFSGE